MRWTRLVSIVLFLGLLLPALGQAPDLKELLKRMEASQPDTLTVLQGLQERAARLPRLADQFNFAAYLEDYQVMSALIEGFMQPIPEEFGKVLSEQLVLAKDLRKAGLDPTQLEASIRLLQNQMKAAQQLDQIMLVRLQNAMGFHAQALAQGEPLLSEITDPAMKNLLLVSLVAANFETGLPRKARKLMGQVTLNDDNDRFAFGTTALELRYQLEPALGGEDYLQEMERLWPLLNRIPTHELSRPSAQAAESLILMANGLARRLPESDPARAQLKRAVDSHLQQLDALGEKAWAAPIMEGNQLNRAWKSFLAFHALQARIGLARQAREAGELETASTHLETVRDRFARLRERRPEMASAVEVLFQGMELRPDLKRGFLSSIPARYHEEKGRLEEASGALTPELARKVRAELDQALGLYQEGGNSDLELLRLLPDYALLAHSAGGSAKDSLTLIEEALTTSGKMSLRRGVIEGHLARGELRARTGEKALAVKDLEKGLELVEAFVTETGPQTPVSLELQERARPAYQRLATLQAEKNPSAALSALGRLSAMQTQSNVIPALVGNPELGTALQKVREGQIRLRSLETESVALRAAAPSKVRAKALEAHDTLLAQTKAEFYDSLGELYRQNPEFERLAVRPVNFARVQKHVPPNTLVVQYFPTEDGLYLFTLDRQSLKTRKVALPSQELDLLLSKFTRSMLRRSSDSEVSERLYAHLITPLEEDLKGKEVLAVVPTGRLLYLPFSALSRQVEGRPEFLLERFQTVSLVKSSDLDLLDDPTSGKSPGNLIALGNPDGSLEAAAQEVEALKQLFPAASVYFGAKATKALLQRLDAKGVRYLHFATHGVLDARDPRASHLILAGKGEQSRLSVSEIAGLDLGEEIELVTLSACRTALSEASPRSEMLQSMADAFGYAGSPSVVASLWAVSDESTSLLMEEFYRRLREGDSRVKALQQASLKVARDERFTHPYYWAPFVLMGDWR